MLFRKKALTLIELIIATTILTAVLLTASGLLISFRRFYSDYVERQTKISEVSLALFEEIVNRLTVANNVVITGASKIDIRVDNTNPADPADDTTYTYWKDQNTIKYKYKIDGSPESAEKVVAEDVSALNFELQPIVDSAVNRVKISIGVTIGSGVAQNFETTVVIRCSAAKV